MKAFEISAHEPGRLVAVERPEPRPGPREVLVAMSAASLNARDLQILDGHYPISKPLPLVPLSDGVGRVIALGDEVTRVERGERVLGTFAQRWLRGRRSDDTWASTLGADLDGVLQERIVLHEDGLVRAPSHLSDEEAATLPCAGVTAWQALVTAGNVRADETVLVQGTGAVALFALQFAKLFGARAIVTSASSKKLERAFALGAWAGVDRTRSDWIARVRELTRGQGVDHVVDVSGDLAAALACLRTGGLVSVIGYMSSLRLEADLIPFLLANARVQGISVGPRSSFEEMVRAITASELKPVVGEVIPFKRAPEAFAAYRSRERFGKVVIRF